MPDTITTGLKKLQDIESRIKEKNLPAYEIFQIMSDEIKIMIEVSARINQKLHELEKGIHNQEPEPIACPYHDWSVYSHIWNDK